MFSLQTNKSYTINEYAEFADIGIPAMAKGQNIFQRYNKLETSIIDSILDYAEGAFITLRGVPFSGYIHPYPDLINNNLVYATLAGNSIARTIINQSGTYSPNNNTIRANLLLNYQAYQGKKVAENIKVELMTYYMGGNTSPIVFNGTLVVKLKKVDKLGTITTLKTFTTYNLPNEGGTTPAYRKVEFIDNNTIAVLNEGDILYIDVVMQYYASTFNANTEYGFANNGSLFTFLSL